MRDRTMKHRCMQLLLLILLSGHPLSAKKFYLDDPLLKEPTPLSLDDVQVHKLVQYTDFFVHTLGQPGERNTKRRVIPSKAINTLGEPMEGAWYTRRHYWNSMTNEEL